MASKSGANVSKRSKNLIIYIIASLIVSGVFYYAKPRFVLKDNPTQCKKESYCKKGLIADKCKIYTVCEKIDEINILSVLLAGFGTAAVGWFIYYLFTGDPGFFSGLIAADILFGW